MKRLFFAVVVALVFAGNASANNGTSTAKIVKTVNEHFIGATNIEVSEKKDYVHVSFVQDGENVQAFYDFSGQLIGNSLNINLSKLPTNAKRTFAKKYSDYPVTEAILFESPEEVAYYISAQKDGQNIVLKVSEAGMVGVFKKMKN